jgi:hypothetical protein
MIVMEDAVPRLSWRVPPEAAGAGAPDAPGALDAPLTWISTLVPVLTSELLALAWVW